MEKNTKFALTLKKTMSLLHMTQTSQGSHTGQLEDAKLPKDMTSGPICTDFHLFLQWVKNQKWHGPSLGNQGGRGLVQDKAANYTVSTRAVPRALLAHSVLLTCESSWRRPFQDDLAFISQEKTLLFLGKFLHVKSRMVSQVKVVFLTHFPF